MDYLPNTDAQLQEMLGAIGAGSFEDLLVGIPSTLRQQGLAVPSGLAEAQVLDLCLCQT